MEHINGEIAAKRAKLSAAAAAAAAAGDSEDRLSALPDDVLVHILLHLGSTAAAARTSLLSRRWRRLWVLLPALEFYGDTAPHNIRAALAAHELPTIHHLRVAIQDSSPDSVATWLPIAARRLCGDLVFCNMAQRDDANDEAEERGAFELPCFEDATSIYLDLGHLGLSLPPSGVFARLVELYLNRLQFHGPCELGDATYLLQFPSLLNLTVNDVWGLGKLTIHSESLLRMELKEVHGLQQLTLVAPALKVLNVMLCFADPPFQSQPVADISAPQLVMLKWSDAYDPSSVQLGEMPHLKSLESLFFYAYGPEACSAHNLNCLRLLRRFEVIHSLILSLTNIPHMYIHDEYLMEDMARLPDITFLSLRVMTNGHSFGASSFHVFRMCTAVRKLRLMLCLDPHSHLEVQNACLLGCICEQPPNWETEQLVLSCLQEVEIDDLRGTEHEVAFVERLFTWATVLKTMAVTFHPSITESKANELCQIILSYPRPDICTKFYMYHHYKKVLYVPEGPDLSLALALCGS